ncbi:MAG: hypothetical protein LZF60_250055 [Nitrospira sp.]|nr:MAG: hypothetical protein LZF60_250055 [Nitrospira sp.]
MPARLAHIPAPSLSTNEAVIRFILYEPDLVFTGKAMLGCQ